MTDTFDVTNPDKPTIVKDPNATLDYTWDWSAWLVEAGNDTIVSQQILASTPAGLSIGSPTQSLGKVTVFISGGAAGTKYQVTCRINTAGGRIDDRSIYLKVKDR